MPIVNTRFSFFDRRSSTFNSSRMVMGVGKLAVLFLALAHGFSSVSVASAFVPAPINRRQNDNYDNCGYGWGQARPTWGSPPFKPVPGDYSEPTSTVGEPVSDPKGFPGWTTPVATWVRKGDEGAGLPSKPVETWGVPGQEVGPSKPVETWGVPGQEVGPSKPVETWGVPRQEVGPSKENENVPDKEEVGAEESDTETGTGTPTQFEKEWPMGVPVIDSAPPTTVLQSQPTAVPVLAPKAPLPPQNKRKSVTIKKSKTIKKVSVKKVVKKVVVPIKKKPNAGANRQESVPETPAPLDDN
jgi:hypothetical protein